ncbi:MAG: protein-tyrosine-phosphatase [Sphingobacteriales bacterium]|nr:protein-tyrosine-phosphatase [Sphingobacteriales bacterium]
MVYEKLYALIGNFNANLMADERKETLQPLIQYIQEKQNKGAPTNLNFICTHNSRRSHLSQIWAQTMAYHFGIKNIYCYSGGTEATAMFPKVVETLSGQGFQVHMLSESENPIYAVKFAQNEQPIICFSKVYQHDFNPKNNFGAVVTCNNADEACPMVLGAEARFPVKYSDPKAFDNTPQQTEKYLERSLEIAQEMWWLFSHINH